MLHLHVSKLTKLFMKHANVLFLVFYLVFTERVNKNQKQILYTQCKQQQSKAAQNSFLEI